MWKINLIISFIPCIVISLFLFFSDKNKKSLNEILTLILCAILSIVLSYSLNILLTGVEYVIVGILLLIIPSIEQNTKKLILLHNFLQAGCNEELAKFLSIKISKPKTPYKILVNSIIISLILSNLENYAYIYKYSTLMGVFRLLLPGHTLFQLVMAIFMIKAMEYKNNNKNRKSKLFTFFALIIPMFLHAIFDTALAGVFEYNINIPLTIIFGICSYITIFAVIIYIKRKYPNTSEEITKKVKTRTLVWKSIIILLCVTFWIYAFAV